MDDIVKAALRKWPHVPACYDWLALDQRGEWYMRDDRAQQAGPFPQIKGSRIRHEALRAFIHRNYAVDAQGAWYFQNGPQRVYVTLEAAPWILRSQVDGTWHTHTGRPAQVQSTWLDEQDRLLAHTDLGLALIHSQDMLHAAEALERQQWPSPTPLLFVEAPARFAYVLRPQAQTTTVVTP